MKNDDRDHKRQCNKELASTKAPFKKAKYAWQIKRTSSESTSMCETNDVMNVDDTIQKANHDNVLSDPASRRSDMLANPHPAILTATSSEKNMQLSEENCREHNDSIKQKTNINCQPDESKAECKNSECLSFIEDSISNSICNDLKQTIDKADGRKLDTQEPTVEIIGSCTTETQVIEIQDLHSLPPTSSNVLEDCRIIERVLLRKWQNMHCSKALIENAINKSLEEMGATPESSHDEQHAEEAGILTAIQRQGLTTARPALTAEQRQRIMPMLDSLTQATENILTNRAYAYSALNDEQNISYSTSWHTETAAGVGDTDDTSSVEESHFMGHVQSGNGSRSDCDTNSVQNAGTEAVESISSEEEDSQNLNLVSSVPFQTHYSCEDDVCLNIVQGEEVPQSPSHFMDAAVLMAIDQQGLTLQNYSDDNYQ
ncbi:uncharacterized protein LOC106150994 [Lingula anatina]|uniref:Uncharacterized protein LOC106150994 n=1 Tax=Lingula anatina TaxID=7574 RepID=A0A1S3H2Z1_LINAN|nr:uncharacterized protein LOC106150994 [Lingula anatina]XP_013379504.1 uncharacterized protein LOC106150994 [Lingula anatina]|eukprot:XP_013379503.1 uncharacterized protein LOC106150994 [Lingula anatina]